MKNRHSYLTLLALVLLALASPAWGAVKKKVVRRSAAHPVAAKAAARNVTTRKAVAKLSPKRRRSVRRYYSQWDSPTYADSTLGDNTDGEDLEVRRAAVEALGPLNGAVVVTDPNTGRLLTIVNQKLALGEGYQPCSTIKVPVALAALSEGVIERDTKLKLGRRTYLDMTQALAKSDNPYFAKLGERLGYERVSYYAHLFGLGEKAGLDIPGENAGFFPSAPPKFGGMGMLTSFGEEIQITPLQLAAFMSAIANRGTLYYLQYPRTDAEVAGFQPRIKRKLDIEKLLPEVRPGMVGATQFGTARRLQIAFTDEPVLGKTGTCSDKRKHLGWFGSFTEPGPKQLVVAVLLTGGKPSVGPAAAGVAGEVYRRLADRNYAPPQTVIAKNPLEAAPVAIIHGLNDNQ